MSTATVVAGIFDPRNQARDALDRLVRSGVPASAIRILTTDPREADRFAEEAGARMVRGALLGAGLGGVVGALLAWGAQVGGWLPAADPLGAAILGAVLVGGFGAFLGLVIGLAGRAAATGELERELRSGRTLLLVDPAPEPAPIEAILHQSGAHAIRHFTRTIG